MAAEVVQQAEFTETALGEDLYEEESVSEAHVKTRRDKTRRHALARRGWQATTGTDLLGEHVGDLLDRARLASLAVSSRGDTSAQWSATNAIYMCSAAYP